MAVALGCSASTPAPILQADSGAKYLAHEVIVQRAPGASDDELRRALAALGGKVVDEASPLTSELGYLHIELPAQVTADQAANHLLETGVAARAERNYIVELSVEPNDPLFSDLWGMAKIGAPRAWERGVGSSDVVVAVSDSGIDYRHPELEPNLWRNPGEIPGNQIDDDGNGFVDDVNGWNWVTGTNDPMDDNKHGTHVAGTIGAVGGNGEGVAGVVWNVRLQALKFLGASGSGSLWNGAQTILYAAKMGAKIVSASWGCNGCTVSYYPAAIQKLADAGGLLVAAAGNSAADNLTSPHYPASYANPNIVSVAATQPDDQLATFSNWGATNVHVAAPGVSIVSTVPQGGYRALSGTSMATPHVSGAAALLWSLAPLKGWADVKQALMDSCTPVAALTGRVVCGGRLDVDTLTRDLRPPAAPRGVSATAGTRSDVRLAWQANDAPDLAGYRVRWGQASGQYTARLDVPKNEVTARVYPLENGVTYYFVVQAVNRDGLISPPSEERSAVPADATAPPQVVDLTADALPGDLVPAFVIGSSGEFSSYWAADHLADGDLTTAWISPGRTLPEPEEVVLLLQDTVDIDQIVLAPSTAYPDFFPVDFDLDVSSDGWSWSTVGGLRNVTVTAGDRVHIAFPTVEAAQVRLRVLASRRHASGFFYAGLAEIEVREISPDPDAVRLQFTAPGDDPGEGRAASYDLRRAEWPLSPSTFDLAARVTMRTPAAAGVWEGLLVSGLASGTTYYFALKATDEAGNVSEMSNVAVASTLVVPPSAVTDLAVRDTDIGVVTLAWTAPGADGKVGQAASYELRYSEAPIHAGNFGAATAVVGLPRPAASGSAESFAVTGLPSDKVFYFALRAVDAGGTAGGLSNVVSALAKGGVDTVAPATVGDLTAFPSGTRAPLDHLLGIGVSGQLGPVYGVDRLTDGRIDTAWLSPPGDPGTSQWVIVDLGGLEPVSTVRLNAGPLVAALPAEVVVEVGISPVAWTEIGRVKNWTPRVGAWGEWTLPVTYARFLRLALRPKTAGQSVGLGELEVERLATPAGATLTWVAPGDDGWIGTAAAYDLRRFLSPFGPTTFDAALGVPIPAPQPGGMIELVVLPALEMETTHYLALKARDRAGNASGMSNLVALDMPGVPPAPVEDLQATALSTTEIRLAWTASGDDGLVGTAAAYDLRVSETHLTPESFASAQVVPTAAPRPAGAAEELVVGGLEPNTTYYFALQVIDDRGQRALLSWVASAATLDGIPPAAVMDLTASPVDPRQAPPLALSVVDSSGAYSPSTLAVNLLDGDASTMWMTPGRETAQEEFVHFDLGGAHRLGRFRMRGMAGYLDLFPVDFRLEVQATTGGPWLPALGETGFFPFGGWEEWMLGSVPAVAARFVVSRSALYAGKAYVALADLELYDDPTDYGRILLAWTASGDDGTRGTPASYDVRRGSQPIGEALFSTATPVPDAPTPHPAGTLERMEVSGLAPDTAYCFALRAADERANVSAVSNSPCTRTPGLPPATVTDLQVVQVTGHSVTLAWTAPSSPGGAAGSYDLRFAAERLHPTSWDAATPVPGLPAPRSAGRPESFTVTGLNDQTIYYFALRARSTSGDEGAISNNASARTPDATPPSRVTDLVATTITAASGSLLMQWTAPGDLRGQVASYDLRYSPQPIDEINFAGAPSIAVPATHLTGGTESTALRGLALESLYYLALRSVDTAGNASALSNVAVARTREEPPAAVIDLRVTGSSGPSPGQATLALAWTAPGENGTDGTAVRYDIRYSTGLIAPSTFGQADAVLSPPAPKPGGSPETFTLGGLKLATTYCVALKAVDARGNLSGISTVVCYRTADGVAPAEVTDLQGTTGLLRGQVDLAWTAPGDDGFAGSAQRYEIRWSLRPIDASNVATAGLVMNAPLPVPGGLRQTFTASQLPDQALVYFVLRAADAAGNWSPLSNLASARTLDVPPTAVTDLRQVAQSASSVTVGWTAPPCAGTAVRYDVRYAPSPLDAGNFASGTPVPSGTPRAPWSYETLVISGLPSNSTYYVALRTEDDRGNWSPLSNVAKVSSADVLPPGQITNLVGAPGASFGSVALTWTATGNDGSVGTAQVYQLYRSTQPFGEAQLAQAVLVLGLPAPRAAGSAEAFTVLGLANETRYYFAIRALDASGNAGPLSPNAVAATLPIPPAPVWNLAAKGSPGAATLSWTATGDNGTAGTATSYDLRYATAPINAANFAAATPAVGLPAPATSGAAETFTLNGLREKTTYWFALVVTDDVGSASGLSNVAQATTPDLTAPAAPAQLSAAPPKTPAARLAATADASSTLGPAWQAASAVDGKLATSWSSKGTAPGEFERLTLELAAAKAVDRIRLTPDAAYPGLFPRDFFVEVSLDRVSWKTVVAEQDFVVAPSSGAFSWGFRSETARYLRLSATETAASYGLHYAIVAEAEAFLAEPTDGQTVLTWMAPGDDGWRGQAAKYEIFRAAAAFDESTLGAAQRVAGAPTPAAAGSLESVTVGGMPGETTFYWAVRAIDTSGNIGPLSAVVSSATNDVRPSAVGDLVAAPLDTTRVRLTWTAPGDDAVSGQAERYELRYASGPLSSQNVDGAKAVDGLGTPAQAGSTESVTVGNLAPGTTYRFVLAARDHAGNWSYWSNVALVVATPDADHTAPAAVTDLMVTLPDGGGQAAPSQASAWSSEQAPAFAASALVDGRLDSLWASAPRTASQEEWVRIDAGEAVLADRVRAWPATAYASLFPPSFEIRVSPDGLAWTTVASQSGFSAVAGQPVEASFAAQPVRFVELAAHQLAPGGSGLYYAVLAELELVTAPPLADSVAVSWTAPGDDGMSGQATAYDLRYGSCPFQAGASLALPASVPAIAGTPERLSASGLAPGTYCFALITLDEVQNASPQSNVVQITIP